MTKEKGLIEIYEKHVGINAEMEYTPTPREWVLDAMKEYAINQKKEVMADGIKFKKQNTQLEIEILLKEAEIFNLKVAKGIIEGSYSRLVNKTYHHFYDDRPDSSSLRKRNYKAMKVYIGELYKRIFNQV